MVGSDQVLVGKAGPRVAEPAGDAVIHLIIRLRVQSSHTLCDGGCAVGATSSFLATSFHSRPDPFPIQVVCLMITNQKRPRSSRGRKVTSCSLTLSIVTEVPRES
jgi:hypothetical protein